MTAALIGALAVPALAGAALLVLGRRLDRAAGVLGVAAAAAVLVLVLLAPRGAAAQPFVPGGALVVAVDGLPVLVLVLVAAVSLAVLVWAAAERQGARFTGLMLVFVAAVVLTASAATLPALLAGWEVMGATSGLLIALHLADREAVAGGLTAFVTTRTADLGLYLAVGAAAAGGGGLALADLPSAAPGWRDAVAAGVLVAALGKAAQLPFSFWLARAMTGPSAVSALLHSAAMVAMGGYLLLRVQPLLAATGWAGPVTAWIGALSAVLLGIVALGETDLKRLLAASTGAQLGFVVLAAGVGATAGGTAQLLAHAVTKAALFLVAGAWLAVWGQRRIADLAGAGRRDRVTGVVATVAAASLAGLPPLSVWAAKDLLLAAAGPALLVAGLVGALLSAAYSGRIVRTVWRPAAEGADATPVRVALVAPAAVLAAAAVVLAN
ncbi:proton-conducting transporter membrane subunit, partial [Amnibacterium endophyticum]